MRVRRKWWNKKQTKERKWIARKIHKEIKITNQKDINIAKNAGSSYPQYWGQNPPNLFLDTRHSFPWDWEDISLQFSSHSATLRLIGTSLTVNDMSQPQKWWAKAACRSWQSSVLPPLPQPSPRTHTDHISHMASQPSPSAESPSTTPRLRCSRTPARQWPAPSKRQALLAQTHCPLLNSPDPAKPDKSSAKEDNEKGAEWSTFTCRHVHTHKTPNTTHKDSFKDSL